MKHVEQQVIAKPVSQPQASDYDFLRKKGIRLLQDFSGNTWTDYNVHDPGVTILELLCYTITDLAYRTGFPIEEILSDKEGKINLDDNALFPAGAILTTNPVSATDFRKVIIDEVEEVENAWVEPVLYDLSIPAEGLYRITVQVKPGVAKALTTDPALGEGIKTRVRALFISKRNLGEDLLDVHVLQPVIVSIDASMIIGEEIKPEVLLADIYRKLQVFLTSPVNFYSREEMLSKGVQTEDIYAGPLLHNGFIADAELAPVREKIDPADMSSIISAIPGVAYLKHLKIIVPGFAENKTVYSLGKDHFATLDADSFADTIRLFRDAHPVVVKHSLFLDELAKAGVLMKGGPGVAGGQSYLTAGIKSVYRDIAAYRSVHHYLPLIYGTGKEGLPPEAPASRKAHAKQLRAYLLFFEQVFANYLAQVAGMRHLFSPGISDEDRSTYPAQAAYDVPGLAEILKAFDGDAGCGHDSWEQFVNDPANAYALFLKQEAEGGETFRERKNQLLDHLLARFNENPSAYPVTFYHSLYGAAATGDPVIHWKAAWLKDIVALGADRVRAFDYLQAGEEGELMTGYEKRMARLLYIRPLTKRSLIAPFVKGTIHVTRAEVITANPPPEADRKIQPGDKPGLLHYMEQEEEVRKLFEAGKVDGYDNSHPPGGGHVFSRQPISFFRYGMDASRYLTGPAPGGNEYLTLFRRPLNDEWTVISRHSTRAEATAARRHLTDQLRNINTGSEGFHLIEHILLRPAPEKKVFGFRFIGHDGTMLFEQAGWLSYYEREALLAGLKELLLTESPGNTPAFTRWLPAIRFMPAFDSEWLRHDPSPAQNDMTAGTNRIAQLWMLLQPVLKRKEILADRLEMVLRVEDGRIINEDFFNFKMTVLLPGWPARFQDTDFRSFTIDLLRANAPAHLGVNVKWTGIATMQEIEPVYFKWREAIRSGKNSEAFSTNAALLINYLLGES